MNFSWYFILSNPIQISLYMFYNICVKIQKFKLSFAWMNVALFTIQNSKPFTVFCLQLLYSAPVISHNTLALSSAELPITFFFIKCQSSFISFLF